MLETAPVTPQYIVGTTRAIPPNRSHMHTALYIQPPSAPTDSENGNDAVRGSAAQLQAASAHLPSTAAIKPGALRGQDVAAFQRARRVANLNVGRWNPTGTFVGGDRSIVVSDNPKLHRSLCLHRVVSEVVKELA